MVAYSLGGQRVFLLRRIPSVLARFSFLPKFHIPSSCQMISPPQRTFSFHQEDEWLYGPVRGPIVVG